MQLQFRECFLDSRAVQPAADRYIDWAIPVLMASSTNHEVPHYTSSIPGADIPLTQ
jgi:hypothetical protein